MNQRILVCAADRGLRDAVVGELGREGHDARGRERLAARWAAAYGPADALIVGGLERPGEHLALVRAVRAGGHPPLDSGVVTIVIGGRGELELVRAFEAGCDDFLSTPLAYLELRTRLRAALARPRRSPGERLRVGSLTVDRRTQRAAYRGRAVSLTALQFRMLARLASAPRGGRDPPGAVARGLGVRARASEPDDRRRRRATAPRAARRRGRAARRRPARRRLQPAGSGRGGGVEGRARPSCLVASTRGRPGASRPCHAHVVGGCGRALTARPPAP